MYHGCILAVITKYISCIMDVLEFVHYTSITIHPNTSYRYWDVLKDVLCCIPRCIGMYLVSMNRMVIHLNTSWNTSQYITEYITIPQKYIPNTSMMYWDVNTSLIHPNTSQYIHYMPGDLLMAQEITESSDHRIIRGWSESGRKSSLKNIVHII